MAFRAGIGPKALPGAEVLDLGEAIAEFQKQAVH